MNVYAVPVGAGRHELYCEVADPPDFEGEESRPRPGVFSRLVGRFRDTLADVERERHAPPETAHGWPRRAWRWALRHLAEAVAEQRLLWHLRRQSAATFFHPDDLDTVSARAILRRALARDRDRHARWLVIDGSIAAVTGPLFFFVPGPNLVAYYFVFRAVGHFFAWRGARRGLDRVTWRLEASAPLGEIRAALRLPPGERAARLHDVEARLRLQRLAAFVGRVAVAGA